MPRNSFRPLWLLAALLVLSLATPSPAAGQNGEGQELELGSGQLTPEKVVEVARNRAKVTVAAPARARMEKGFKVVLEAALRNVPVYGLTVGVGLNKDKAVFKEVNGQRVVSEELLEVSRQFNLTSLRAHASGVGDPMPAEAVRAGMVIRLNNMLSGGCGAQPEVMDAYVSLLNSDVVPVVPSQGTVGEADITLASHIGLVMAGEWEAFQDGRRMSGAEALRAAGIEPLRPVGKDFLCIISNNALVVGNALLGLYDTEQYLQREIVIFGLSLEGLNGNVAPFLQATTAVRPFPGMVDAASRIRDVLEGSALWQASAERKLQDPLSFRTMAYTIGNVIEAVQAARDTLLIHINDTEDNPLVVLDVRNAERGDSTQLDGYLVGGDTNGAIYPSANFEALPFVSAVERLSLALAKLSDAATMTILRLAEPEITHLSRFLAAPGNEGGHSFGAIQKTFVAVNAENQSLGMPVSLDSVAIAGNIEDTATHSELAVSHFQQIVDNLYEIASYQLLHATQAVDLREGFVLGGPTRSLRDEYRKLVPFVDNDRIFTADVARGIAFLRGWSGRPVEVAAANGDAVAASAGTVPAPFAVSDRGDDTGFEQGLVVGLAVAGGLAVVVAIWLVARRGRPGYRR